MFENIMNSIKFLSPSQASGLSDFGGLLKSIGNPEQYAKEQQAMLMGSQAKAAEANAEATMGELQKQKALEQLMKGLGGYDSQSQTDLLQQGILTQVPVGNGQQPNQPMDIGGFLRKAAAIDPAYAGKLIEYELGKQKAGQPDWKIQEVNGALVRYDANNPNSIPQPIYNGGGKPQTNVAKLKADFDAGLIDKETYQRAVAKEIAPTEKNYKQFQLQNASFADRMVNAEGILQPLEELASQGKFSPVNKTSRALSAIPSFGLGEAVGNVVLSEDQQKYKNAANEWIRAKLRKESGAAIGVKEMEDEYATYFPQVGDGDAVIKQKAQLRKVATDSMIKQTSGAYDDMYGGGLAGYGTDIQPVESKTINGKTYIKKGGKWYQQ